ncbi:kidney mitochondrial carrier protein 1-like [Cyprinodon tularosa]|uniref:kidney mitochondrial carrier protein 1-like n=1 Tax=Cyprinodon tularosa TaxID=77115 RepID=UPI0018E21693|nr:kidney mitochondrial carrier protein 1-like [Cyprinodon tularosa]
MMSVDMLCCQQHYVDLCLGFLLFIAGLQQVEAAADTEMVNLNWKPFIYGGMASIVAEFGTFPIDLTKTRLQVQGQSQYTEVRYRGMFHALFRIGQEEGIRALYSGISPALLRQASYGTIKIGTYNSLKRLFVSQPEDETMIINVFCGVVSGVMSSMLANPTDVLKIRMQAQGSLLQGSMMSNFINIYQTEGTRGLWRVSSSYFCHLCCLYVWNNQPPTNPTLIIIILLYL